MKWSDVMYIEISTAWIEDDDYMHWSYHDSIDDAIEELIRLKRREPQFMEELKKEMEEENLNG